MSRTSHGLLADLLLMVSRTNELRQFERSCQLARVILPANRPRTFDTAPRCRLRMRRRGFRSPAEQHSKIEQADNELGTGEAILQQRHSWYGLATRTEAARGNPAQS